MSKSGSKDLFQLMQSLTKSEKRHFKIYASRHVIAGENNYVKLFDAIEKQKEYNEKTLLKNERYIKQLPLLKNRLYDIIVKSLVVYHTNSESSTVETQLRNYLHHIEILFPKKLYKQCEKTIKKAKAIATQYENHLYLLKLLEWEMEIIAIQAYVGKEGNDLKNLFDEMFAVNVLWKNCKQYDFLESQLFLKTTQTGYIRKYADMNIFHTILKHPLLASEDKALTFKSRYFFNRCHFIYAFVKDDYSNMYYYSQKLLNLMGTNTHQIKEHPLLYHSILFNLILSQFRLKKYAEIPTSIAKLEQMEKECINRNYSPYTVINFKVDLYMDTGQFEEGIKYIKSIQNSIDTIEKKDVDKEREILLYYAIACIYFGTKNYTMANFYMNKILNAPFMDYRNDIYCFARIISLIIHFELGNKDLLEYTVKSTYYFLSKKERLFQFETILLSFIKNKIPKLKSQKELINAFVELKSSIAKTTKDTFERKALDYFDFISWLESKIEGRAFAEVVREKAIGH